MKNQIASPSSLEIDFFQNELLEERFQREIRRRMWEGERGGDRAAARASEVPQGCPGQAGAPHLPPPQPQPGQPPHPHPCWPSVLTLHRGPGGLAWETRPVPTSCASLSSSGTGTGLHSKAGKDGLSCLPVEGSSAGRCEPLSTAPGSVKGGGQLRATGKSQPSPGLEEGQWPFMGEEVCASGFVCTPTVCQGLWHLLIPFYT